MGTDGNCMFRALSDQLKGTEIYHVDYRTECADYIEENQELYKFFIEDDEDIDDYIKWIRKDARWGGQLEMNALAQIHNFNVVVHQVDNPSMAQEFFPWGTVPCLHVAYHLGEHYNSVRRADDTLEGPAIDFPIGHILKEVAVPLIVATVPVEEEKKKEEDLKIAVDGDTGARSMQELVQYCTQLLGLTEADLLQRSI